MPAQEMLQRPRLLAWMLRWQTLKDDSSCASRNHCSLTVHLQWQFCWYVALTESAPLCGGICSWGHLRVCQRDFEGPSHLDIRPPALAREAPGSKSGYPSITVKIATVVFAMLEQKQLLPV